MSWTTPDSASNGLDELRSRISYDLFRSIVSLSWMLHETDLGVRVQYALSIESMADDQTKMGRAFLRGSQ